MTTRPESRALALFTAASALLAALVAAPIATQAADLAVAPSGEIPDLKQLMADPSWLGPLPQDPYWSADGRWIYYEVERWTDGVRDLVRVDPTDGDATAVDDAARGAVEPAGALSHDRRRLAFLRAGDLFVKDLESGAVRQLTRTPDVEADPFFLVGDQAVGFRRGATHFVRDLEHGLESQPFDLRLADDPADDEALDTFLERQQERLFDVVREDRTRRHATREVDATRRRADPTRTPPPIYLGDDTEIVYAALSPRGDSLALALADAERDEGQADTMPVWVTEDGYVEAREVRAKVGTPGDWSHRLAVIDPSTGRLVDVDLSNLPERDDDPLAALRRAAAERERAEAESEDSESNQVEDDRDEAAASDSETPARPIEIEDPIVWSPDGRFAAVSIHSRDNKDRWIVLLEPDGTLHVVNHLRFAEGWINWYFNELGFLPDGRLFFLSETSDRSQLFLHDPARGATRRLSDDRGVVSSPTASPDGAWIYYRANTLDAPFRFDIYRVATGALTEPPERVSDLAGRIDSFRLAPDGARLLFLHSTTTRPPELFVQDARPGADARRLTETVSDAFTAVDWVEPHIVGVPSSHHERPIWSRYYPPRDAERLRAASGSIPAVLFVHGAGYLQNAHAGWSTYFREFMFHSLLAARGYAVLDMDYRGSANYGADWRTAIYRHMGSPELEDLEDGVAWLAAEHGVDSRRVGVYGGSYGGFLALMALFDRPELFACGAALRPVTDWAHYNHPYTSNILNTPSIDPEAYARSSPIEFAAGLDAPLLIAAPMLDDNVFFQDTVRLAQRLIELEKEDWEVAIYPVEPHGFRRPSSWLDEYRRILALFEEHLGPTAGEDAGS
ncbi:MAG: LpqB family beta-propeller domain-containing protein [Acidobacteriota bacterium]